MRKQAPSYTIVVHNNLSKWWGFWQHTIMRSWQRPQVSKCTTRTVSSCRTDACMAFVPWDGQRSEIIFIPISRDGWPNYSSYTQWSTMQLEKMRCGKYLVRNRVQSGQWIVWRRNGNIGKKQPRVYVVITYACKGTQTQGASLRVLGEVGEREHFTMHLFAYFEFLIMWIYLFGSMNKFSNKQHPNQ